MQSAQQLQQLQQTVWPLIKPLIDSGKARFSGENTQ